MTKLNLYENSPFYSNTNECLSPAKPISNEKQSNIFSSSPELSSSISYDDLLRIHNTLKEKLEKKERDLVIAAEFGQQLLVENQKMKKDHLRLHSSIKQADGGSQEKNLHLYKKDSGDVVIIAELEKENIELRAELDSLHKEKASLERSYEKKCALLAENASGAQSELDTILVKLNDLNSEVDRLRVENMELKKSSQNSGQEEELIRLSDMLNVKSSECTDLLHQNQQIQQKLEASQKLTLQLQKNSRDVEEVTQESLELRKDFEKQQNELNELSQAMQSAQDYIEALHSQLSMYEEKMGSNIPEKVGKTLLTEVDDRRQELEQMHEALMNKHAGLKKVFSHTIYQKERMKHHISRLSQLTHSQSDHFRTQQLERALANARSENMELQQRIALMEKEIDENKENALNLAMPLSSQGSFKKDDIVGCLQLHIEKINQELKTLKRQIRTSNMMRLSETERVRECELVVLEKQTENEQLRSALAKLQFQFEEYMLNVKMKQGSLDEDSYQLSKEKIEQEESACKYNEKDITETSKSSSQIPTFDNENAHPKGLEAKKSLKVVENTTSISLQPQVREESISISAMSQQINQEEQATSCISSPNSNLSTSQICNESPLESSTSPSSLISDHSSPQKLPPVKKIYLQQNPGSSQCNQQ